MENEIDDDELVAMLAEDEQEEEEKKNEQCPAKLGFAQQAEIMTPEQLVELTCALVDKPIPKTFTYKLSHANMDDLFGSKTSKKPKSYISTTLTLGIKSESTITPSVYIDPTTHIHIASLNYTRSEIKLKSTSTKLIRLSEIDKQPPPMPTEWCTVAVLASKSDVKQASNGSTYSIWRIADFKTTTNMFLFDDAHQSLWKTTLSSVFLIYDGVIKKFGQLSIKYERPRDVSSIRNFKFEARLRIYIL